MVSIKLFKTDTKPLRRFAAPPLEKGRIITKTVFVGVSIQTDTLPTRCVDFCVRKVFQRSCPVAPELDILAAVLF